jgi:flagellar hook protein FlgE
MSFNVGLSGLRAATSDLNVTGNNIANAGTVGFKQSRAEFADVYAASTIGGGSNTIGSGVQLANVSQQFKQGNVNNTQNGLDLAVNGNGFFVTSNNGEVSYTRAGYFGTDKEGFIVNNFGYKLQGYAVDANGVLQNGLVTDVQIQTASQAPKTTTTVDQTFNLNSNNKVPAAWQSTYDAVLAGPPVGTDVAARDAANLAFDPSDPTTYNSATSTNIYDAQGNSHVMTQYFIKQGGGAPTNTWQMNLLIDGRNPNDPTSEAAYTAALTFSTAGQLIGQAGGGPVGAGLTGSGPLILEGWQPAAPDSAIPPNWSANGAGANAAGIALDLSPSTQFSSSFAVSSVAQDGYTTGQLSGLEVDDTGIIFARYTNGQSKTQGQVVLANFANQQGLTPVGKTAWIQSFESGEPVVGTPRSGTLGALQSGALEDSNVELSDQLVNLIVAQRNYQANAKTIETESAITQTIINLR